MIKKLILMRGITGSKKSTLAKQLVDQGQIFSTDDYFMVDGRYNFDASLLGIYHNKNVNRVKDAMVSGISPVVIDNTNLTLGDMQLYLEMAKEFDYEITVAQINLDCVGELDSYDLIRFTPSLLGGWPAPEAVTTMTAADTAVAPYELMREIAQVLLVS